MVGNFGLNEFDWREWRKLMWELHSDTIRKVSEYFTKLRKKNCTYDIALEVNVLVPKCEDCVGYERHVLDLPWISPDVSENHWLTDLEFLGISSEDFTNEELHCYECHRCLEENRENFYIKKIPLEEYFNLPQGWENEIPRKIRKDVVILYGSQCFSCKKKLSGKDITIDHIVARVSGGPSGITNLQVLCKECNSKKGGNSVSLFCIDIDFLFRGPPSDSYEDPIW